MPQRAALWKPPLFQDTKSVSSPTLSETGVASLRNAFLSHGTNNPSNILSQVFTRDDDPETKQQNCNLFSLLFLVMGMICFVTYFFQVSVYIASVFILEDFGHKCLLFLFVQFLLHHLDCTSPVALPPLLAPSSFLLSTLFPTEALDLITVGSVQCAIVIRTEMET